MDWDKQHLTWKENVGNVEVPMSIDKSDMLKAIMSEGDFAFKSDRGTWTLMNIKNFPRDKKSLKLLRKALWNQVEEYVIKNGRDVKDESKDKLNAEVRR